jgi:RNA polymerase-binding protein DksA
MPTATLKDIQQQLSERKKHLLETIERVKKDVTSEHSADWSEQAQERQNDEVVEAIGNESRAELNKINVALDRIEKGEYTLCSQCGKDIDVKRLQAVPYTDRCIQCAS